MFYHLSNDIELLDYQPGLQFHPKVIDTGWQPLSIMEGKGVGSRLKQLSIPLKDATITIHDRDPGLAAEP